ncbi:MAG: hypothetical protein GWN18_15160, partial [Thermoplasmata archaeon]|nr:hypothetical protein [Thermoplasmata archaeon]NIS13402.1 hypothetical protein [Thermoplasmata archaeon]NIS21285.1 hypothetical protein [Thermoplasmata archaeon]NIT78805.1 hypothetical protein [Thermoplasmata archaeon]NIU50338.1 hypothetical protein [Thermoplasmata archaeon]
MLFRDSKLVTGAVTDAVRASLTAADLVTEAAPRRTETPLDVGTPVSEPEVDVALVVPDVADDGAVSTQMDLAGGALEEERLRSALDSGVVAGEEPDWDDMG